MVCCCGWVADRRWRSPLGLPCAADEECGVNYERKVDSMDSLAGATHDFYEEADDRRKRRRLIVGAVLAALVLAAAWFAFSMSKGDGAAGADGAAGTGAANVPTITVMVPGLQSVQTAIAANGSIAARREMPVGVVGEGGQVVSVLVEPGQ